MDHSRILGTVLVEILVKAEITIKVTAEEDITTGILTEATEVAGTTTTTTTTITTEVVDISRVMVMEISAAIVVEVDMVVVEEVDIIQTGEVMEIVATAAAAAAPGTKLEEKPFWSAPSVRSPARAPEGTSRDDFFITSAMQSSKTPDADSSDTERSATPLVPLHVVVVFDTARPFVPHEDARASVLRVSSGG